LAMFLSSCKVLETVSLHFEGWESESIIPCPLHGVVTVQHVDFIFHDCSLGAAAAICNSVHFPDASELFLTLRDLWDDEDVNTLQLRHEVLIREFLLRHPLTRTLKLDIYLEDSGYEDTRIVPPITVLPALQELVLSYDSVSQVEFSSKSDYLPLPPIRILKLHTRNLERDWSYTSDWVEGLFKQLKKQGDLDAFEMLAISDVSGRTDPSMLKGVIHDYLPLEKIYVGCERWRAAMYC